MIEERWRRRFAGALASTVFVVGLVPAAAAGSVQQAAAPPDLVLSWKSMQTQVDVGSSFDASLDIVDLGGPATNVDVVLEVGTGVEVVSGSIGWFGRPCTTVASTATCPIGTITSSTFVGFAFRATAEGPVDVAVLVRSSETDADPTNNSLVRSLYVQGPSAIDLQIAGSPSQPTVAPSEQVNYQLTVTNLFRFATTGVKVTSIVPDAFEIRSTSIGLFRSCAVVGQEVTCDIGAFGARGSADIGIVLVARERSGPVELSASVSGAVPDPFPDDDVTTSVVTIEGVAQPPDLVVSLDLAETAYSGATVDGKLQVTNLGGQVSGIVAELHVPEGLGLVSATTGLNSHSCDIAGTTVTCAIGSSPTFWFVDLEFAPADGKHEIAASVRSDQTDADPSSNATSRTIEVGGIAPISFEVASQVSRDLVRPGDVVTYRVDVTDASAVPATAVVVAGAIPDAFEIRSVRIGWLGRPCTVTGQDVSCRVGDLAARTSKFILFELVVADDAPSGSFALSARIVGSIPEAMPSGSGHTSVVVVDATGSLPDLNIRASLDPSTTVGTATAFTMSFANGGVGPATGVVATVQIPDGLEVVSTSIGWFGRACSVVDSAGGATATCTLSSSSKTWFGTITVQPSSPGTYAVAAAVHGDQEDADPADDSILVSTTATPPT